MPMFGMSSLARARSMVCGCSNTACKAYLARRELQYPPCACPHPMCILLQFPEHAILDQQDAVRRLREPLVVRNHDEGDTALAIYLTHQGKHFCPRAAIEVASRLI